MHKMIVKSATVVVVAIVLCVLTGCDGNRTPRRAKKILSSSEIKNGVKPPVKQKKTSDVGVGDVADYATGVTQLKSKENAEKRLENIYSTRSKGQRKALNEQ